MWAVIHCLKTWGHYIGSKDVVVWTDNVTLKNFVTQPKLSSKQVRLTHPQFFEGLKCESKGKIAEE
jgi:hypothetical protein